MSHSKPERANFHSGDDAIMWWELVGKKISNIFLYCWFFLLNYTDSKHYIGILFVF